MSSCGDFVNPRVCGDQTWTAKIKVTDYGIGGSEVSLTLILIIKILRSLTPPAPYFF